MAAAGSFFEQVAPSATVHPGMCSNASHWFRTEPDVDPSEGMYSSEVFGAVRARAAELAPGLILRSVFARHWPRIRR